MRLTAVDIIEMYEEILLDEALDISPREYIGGVLYFDISGTTYGFTPNPGEDGKELWRKFVKMVTQYNAGGKAFAWLKKFATHTHGGKTGKPVPSNV